jgi:Pyridoxamine 5'-phosphate oxidase
MASLADTAPRFVEMAHQIVWSTVATVAADGRPRSRVLHPIWEWDNTDLTGWIATGPGSPKARDLAHKPRVSLTYWAPAHDTCTAECTTAWESTSVERRRGWQRFADAPAPVGYDPAIVPGWSDPDADAFGILRLEPFALRFMDGSLMLTGTGDMKFWRR